MKKQKREFDYQIDKDTKIRIHDFSMNCHRPDLIIIKVWRNIYGWVVIGTATIEILENLKKAEWVELTIGCEEPPRNTLYKPTCAYQKFRNIGIGSKVVNSMLKYLKENGIEEVYGEINKKDNVDKTINFWNKNGFKISFYNKPRGDYVAGISINLWNNKKKAYSSED
jgi:GNAT superfamily N-acetyltransferase